MDRERGREHSANKRVHRLIGRLQADPSLADGEPASTERLRALLGGFVRAIGEDARRNGLTPRHRYTDDDLQRLFSFAVYFFLSDIGRFIDEDYEFQYYDWEAHAVAQWKIIHSCKLPLLPPDM